MRLRRYDCYMSRFVWVLLATCRGKPLGRLDQYACASKAFSLSYIQPIRRGPERGWFRRVLRKVRPHSTAAREVRVDLCVVSVSLLMHGGAESAREDAYLLVVRGESWEAAMRELNFDLDHRWIWEVAGR